MERFDGKVVVITGAAQGIGRCMAQTFRDAGATVCIMDVKQNDGFVGDLSRKEDMERFAAQVLAKHDLLVNIATMRQCWNFSIHQVVVCILTAWE